MWDGFLADVAQHFQDEEAILAEAGYPAAVQHADQHRALVEKAVALATRFHDGTLTLGELFNYWHRTWCRNIC